MERWESMYTRASMKGLLSSHSYIYLSSSLVRWREALKEHGCNVWQGNTSSGQAHTCTVDEMKSVRIQSKRRLCAPSLLLMSTFSSTIAVPHLQMQQRLVDVSFPFAHNGDEGIWQSHNKTITAPGFVLSAPFLKKKKILFRFIYVHHSTATILPCLVPAIQRSKPSAEKRQKDGREKKKKKKVKSFSFSASRITRIQKKNGIYRQSKRKHLRIRRIQMRKRSDRDGSQEPDISRRTWTGYLIVELVSFASSLVRLSSARRITGVSSDLLGRLLTLFFHQTEKERAG